MTYGVIIGNETFVAVTDGNVNKNSLSTCDLCAFGQYNNCGLHCAPADNSSGHANQLNYYYMQRVIFIPPIKESNHDQA